MGPYNVRNGRNNCQACITCTKWLPVLFIVAVISWSYYAFAIQLCLFTMKELWLQILTLVIYHVVMFLFLWAYWRTIFSPTSRVPRKFKIPQIDFERVETATTEEEVNSILDNLVRTQQLPVQTRTNINQYRFCEKCSIIKPDRAHHCSVCSQCVLKMDHHCPWVNNCVCFENYKFFILFLGYAFIYCLVIFSFSFRYFIDFWRNDWTGPVGGRFHVLFVFFVSAMFAISLVSLLGYHLFLVSRNRTTLESFRAPTFRNGPDKKGFNIGGYANFMEVFGEDKKLWFLPVFTSLGDGISFPTRHSFNLNGNYNSIDNTDSTTASSSGNSPDQCVEIKVEARNEPRPPGSNGHSSPATGGGVNGKGGGQRETPLVYF